MMSKKPSILLLIAAIASLLVSCGSSKNTGRHSYRHGGSGNTRTFEIPQSLPPQSHALLSEAKSWIGTPYKYGGEDKRGVDCSGLVLKVYKSALDIKLPRNSAQQADYCSPLQKNQLLPGDLIFFATSGSRRKVSHVGIYVGDGKMIHSSASSGVVVSDISSDYFVKTYAGAGSVDKYRAMISGDAVKRQVSPATPAVASNSAKTAPKPGQGKPPKPAKAPKANSSTAVGAIVKATPVTADAPSTAVTDTPAASEPSVTDGSITYTPVSSLPKKAARTAKERPEKTSSTAAQATAPASRPTVRTVTAENASSKAEPTAEEARKAVLNSIIEQKIDSIFKP